jgi:hypothetical protein
VQLKPGLRLRSQVCSTEVIVVRPATDDLDLTCGGKPMVDLTADVDGSAAPAPGLDTGSQMGKRYTTEDESGLELLVTKAGDGTLAAGDIPLVLKDAKPLPSSD